MYADSSIPTFPNFGAFDPPLTSSKDLIKCEGQITPTTTQQRPNYEFSAASTRLGHGSTGLASPQKIAGLGLNLRLGLASQGWARNWASNGLDPRLKLRTGLLKFTGLDC